MKLWEFFDARGLEIETLYVKEACFELACGLNVNLTKPSYGSKPLTLSTKIAIQNFWERGHSGFLILRRAPRNHN